MLDTIVKDLAEEHFLNELSNETWLNFSIVFAQEVNEHNRSIFITALSKHSGIPAQQLNDAFSSLRTSDHPVQQAQILLELQQAQHNATAKIISFRQHHVFKTIDIDSVPLPRTVWNMLINELERQKSARLTSGFFLASLSKVLGISIRNTIALLTNRQQLERGAKHTSYFEELPKSKRICFSLPDGDGPSPLIGVVSDPILATKLNEQGIRTVESLALATPRKENSEVLYRTPGGKTARPLYNNGLNSLYKHLTPENQRVRPQDISIGELMQRLPAMHVEQAGPVVYTATLDNMNERQGEPRRQSARSITGASAAEIFRANGVTICPDQNNAHHWAHLIAHFLADSSEIASSISGKDVVNLVPTTAAANYNTLHTIELHIAKLLQESQTDKVHIQVTPKYNGDNLIPYSLVYILSWEDKIDIMMNKEMFYINPQSHLLHTQKTQAAIRVLRKGGLFASNSSQNEDNSNSASSPLSSYPKLTPLS